MAGPTFVYLLAADKGGASASVVAAFETEEAARRAAAGLDPSATYSVHLCPLFASGAAFLWAQRVPVEAT